MYHLDKNTNDIVIDGWEQGIASSPHKGLGDLRCGDINTIPGEVMCNYGRVQQNTGAYTATNGIVALDTTHLEWTYTGVTPYEGMTIKPTASTISGIGTGGTLFIRNPISLGGSNYSVQIAGSYGGTVINTLGTTGSLSFTQSFLMGKAVGWASYYEGGVENYAYYVLDSNGFVWRYNPSDTGLHGWATLQNIPVNASGGMFIYGNYLVVVGDYLYYKGVTSAALLGTSWTKFANNETPSNNNASTNHFAILGHDDVIYFCDGNGLQSLTVVAGQQASYFNPATASTYVYSNGSGAGSGVYALTLPNTEVTVSLAELNTNLIIGCTSSNLYSWNRTPISIGNGSTLNSYFFPIFLPEAWVQQMVTVNNLLYIFCGNKGNVYITNGSTVSGVLTVPDSTTGQIEPYYVFGGSMYLRGRVWFSIKDSNSKTGGIWSFVPQMSYFIQQDTGASLRLEAQNSYGSYAGYATLLIPAQTPTVAPSAGTGQEARGNQYWAGWDNDSSVYGIDYSDTNPYTGGQTIIETDLVPIGTYIEKANYTSIQTRYAAALAPGESVQVKYRTDLGAAWSVFGDTTTGTDNTAGSVGARWPAPWANALQVQFQIILTSTASSPSFVRFKELRLRKG